MKPTIKTKASSFTPVSTMAMSCAQYAVPVLLIFSLTPIILLICPAIAHDLYYILLITWPYVKIVKFLLFTVLYNPSFVH